MSWETQLQRATYGGVAFDCQVIDDDYTWRVAEHEYPYKDGADIDPMGRRARRTQLSAVFFGDEYEADLGAFLMVLDAQKTKTFQHPILGTWPALATRAPVHHEHSARDMATVAVELVEDGTAAELPDLFSVAKSKQQIGLDKAALSLAVTDFLADPPSTQTPSFLTDVSTALTNAVDAVDDLVDKVESAQHEIATKMNRVRRRADQLSNAVRRLTDVQSYPVVRAANDLAFSCHSLARSVTSAKPRLLRSVLPLSMPIALLAHRLYGDASRATEILAMNAVRNPFMAPVNASLRVLAS